MTSETIAAELKKIEDAAGRLTPEAVVDVASDPASPLHEQFEWDDSEAAHKYRIEQARTLIRSVKVLVQVEERRITTVAYIRDPAASAEHQGYRAVTRVASVEEDARTAVIAEFSRAAAHLRRARDLAIVLGHGEMIDGLLLQLAEAQTHIAPQPASAAA